MKGYRHINFKWQVTLVHFLNIHLHIGMSEVAHDVACSHRRPPSYVSILVEESSTFQWWHGDEGGGGTPGSLLAQGRKVVPGMKGSRMCQFLLTFHVNYNLQHTCPVYVACRMTNA